MKVRIIEDVPIQPVLFNGTIGHNRPAPLYQTALVAARERPGVTRDELCKTLAVPMPWVNRLVSPLVAARYLTETANGIRLTPKGSRADNSLPIDLREGDFLALVCEEPIGGHHVIACMQASEIRVASNWLRASRDFDRLTGQSFSAAGTVKHEVSKGGEIHRINDDLRAGSILEINDSLGLPMKRIRGQIITEDGASALCIRERYMATNEVTLELNCRLPIDLHHQDADKLAAKALWSHNTQTATASDSASGDRLLRTFESISEEARASARGDVELELERGLRCEIKDIPLYPRAMADYQLWAAWRIRQRITGHLSHQAFLELFESEAASTPGSDKYSPAKLEVVERQLTPKQRMYLGASQDWLPLPR